MLINVSYFSFSLFAMKKYFWLKMQFVKLTKSLGDFECVGWLICECQTL